MAAFVYPDDGGDVSGRRLLFVHGTRDRIARIQNVEAVARRLARTASVSLVRVRDGKHAMLSRHRVFDQLACDFVVAALHQPTSWAPGLITREVAGGGRLAQS